MYSEFWLVKQAVSVWYVGIWCNANAWRERKRYFLPKPTKAMLAWNEQYFLERAKVKMLVSNLSKDGFTFPDGDTWYSTDFAVK